MHGSSARDGQDTLLHSVTLFDDEVDTAFVMMGVSSIGHARWTVTQAERIPRAILLNINSASTITRLAFRLLDD